MKPIKFFKRALLSRQKQQLACLFHRLRLIHHLKQLLGPLGAALILSACGSEPASSPPHDEIPQASFPQTEQKSLDWRLSSTFPSHLPIIGTHGKKITEDLRRLSGGKIDITFYEPGVLAPPFETFDAVSYGAIEAGWSTAGYWAGKEAALQFFSAIPFGPEAAEYLAWFDQGGGRELFEELYGRHNIFPLICGLSPPEASGWFKREIKTIDDFKGLKIRFFGLGARVLEKVGAAPQLIAGGEIYQALELGTIDASEYSMPAVDELLAFYEVADHYYFPGWHQQSTLYELLINLDEWKKLDPTTRFQFKTACAANVRLGMAEGEALQAGALKRIEAKGTKIHVWSPEILAHLEKAWLEVAEEAIRSDPDFARVWTSLQVFRADYKNWKSRGYLPPVQTDQPPQSDSTERRAQK